VRNRVSLFVLRRDTDPSEILGKLQQGFPLKLLESAREKVTYLDTFDWRLMDAGMTVTAVSAGRGVRLTVTGAKGEVLNARGSRIPAFADELEDPVLRKRVRRYSKIRRLLPQAKATWSRQLWAVLNKDEKTVARVLVEEGEARLPKEKELQPVRARISVLTMKGYEREARGVARGLKKAGAPVSKADNELENILDTLGAPPERHSSTAILPLDPWLRTDEACRAIHRELLTTMRVNLNGVVKDLDTEFLHELRVAVRRARSALTQVKGVFPEGDVRRLMEELRWIGARTGPTRDMDVYLLKVPSYQASLPKGVRDELVPLVEFLEKKKRKEHRRLVRSLKSARFAALEKAWAEVLDETAPKDSLLPNAGRQVRSVARERILKTFRKILKKGGAIKPDSPAEALHELRIDCKKLRYILTLFRSLFPSGAIIPLIEELKKLQNNLGDFNDLQVQRDALHSFADEMMATGVGPPATLMAMGQLMGQLEGAQERERKAFQKRFQTFARKRNRAQFEELFG